MRKTNDPNGQLRSMIRVALQNCDTANTPNFCKMLAAEGGYQKAESMVAGYALRNRVAIGTAIGHLESELG